MVPHPAFYRALAKYVVKRRSVQKADVRSEGFVDFQRLDQSSPNILITVVEIQLNTARPEQVRIFPEFQRHLHAYDSAGRRGFQLEDSGPCHLPRHRKGQVFVDNIPWLRTCVNDIMAVLVSFGGGQFKVSVDVFEDFWRPGNGLNAING